MTESRLMKAARWAERQLSQLVTDDDGNGAFIRNTGIELAGFGAGIAEFRSALKEAQELSHENDRLSAEIECLRPQLEEARTALLKNHLYTRPLGVMGGPCLICGLSQPEHIHQVVKIEP